MRSFNRYTDLPDEVRGAVIALGNFDGLHRGHQAVIKQVREIAEAHDAPAGIGLFRPHPRRFFQPDAPPFRLMGAGLREGILGDLGVDLLFELPFDEDLREMDDTEFVEIVLHQGLGIRHVVVGDDYGFGKNRCGDVESLKRLCAERGIGVTPVSPVGLHERYGKYGSTELRNALAQGDVVHAQHMLSRPWMVDGIVAQGQQRGRTIGFPTANLDFGDLVRPKYGVYAVECRIAGENDWRPAVANTGTRPTVDGEEARLEVHIFDFDRDIYGQRLTVRFRTFIREEKKFDSFDDLRQQIARDCDSARAVFGLLHKSRD